MRVICNVLLGGRWGGEELSGKYFKILPRRGTKKTL